ncbi:MAG TPA: thioredoxin domain-containing protein, partial [Caldithrix sp.]|nr:thioredoxin domain-containing protein [Caldithrix sp.]
MNKKSNRLIHETSPYLKQHAYNPVNWYPWSKEAFDDAKRLNKPILLSIGYSACHWCHVMERESFENDQIAAIMNDLFINIKVDREERPDIDQIYMHFVQAASGQGGWPMTVFLTPEQKPFFGGTYFPPEDRYGRPGFPKVLKSISHYYHTDKAKLKSVIQQVDVVFAEYNSENEAIGNFPDEQVFNQAVTNLSRRYEPEYGGIGSAPKFPAVQTFQLFLRKYYNDRDKSYLDMVEHTLKNMGRGGIFDQIGGGFARYSVDNKWLVPHFEKMLYDNAQLASLYLDVYSITKNLFYLNIAENVLSFVEREMISDEGGFYSSLDADSGGEEGKYYTWSKAEVVKLLGKKKSEIFCRYFDITDKGNFEGVNIPHIVADKIQIAENFKISVEEVEAILSDCKNILREARSSRVYPGLDDKIIVSWNGLMLSAFARAFQITGSDRYAAILKANINFIKDKLYQDKKLKHTYKNNLAKIDAFIDDYANLIQGLLDAYEALFDTNYIQWAIELTQYVNDKFWDQQNDGYFYTSSDHENLLTRLKDTHDQSIPSANGIMSMNLFRLSAYT